MESLLVVRAGGRLYALAMDAIEEVVPARPITPLPGAAAAVAGMVNVRGRVVPVVELAAALGFPDGGLGPEHRLLVVEHRGRRVGIGVGDVVRIARVSTDACEPVGGESDALWLRGTARTDELTLDLIAIDRLLDAVLF